MIQRDLRKEFQLNPLTALLPNEGSIDVLAKYLEKFSSVHEALNYKLEDNKIFEAEKINLLAEKEMLTCILAWAGLVPRSNNFLMEETTEDEVQ